MTEPSSPNLRRLLDQACAARGDAIFLHVRGREWTYADLGAITDGAAYELRALGLNGGERVAMLLPNGPEHIFAWLAAAKMGAIACPIHPELAPDEVSAALAHLDPAALISARSLRPKLASFAPRLASLRLWIESEDAEEVPVGAPLARPTDALVPEARRPDALLPDILASRRTLEGVPEPRSDAIAEILTTSGTTGRPKAAMIPHRMAVLTGEGFAHWLGITSDDRLFTCLPLAHINARAYSVLGAIAAGASLAIEERFSASRFWESIASSRATEFNAIGAMLRILLGRPESPEDRAHGARLAYGALALGEETHLRFERRFGVRLVVGYGLTESTFGYIHPLTGSRNFASMGRPRRHPDPSLGADARLVVEEEGRFRDAAPGETGEVWLRNPATFAGYFRDDAATRAAFHDGWLRTGDLARVDGVDPGGSTIFVGRLKHVIRRRGENLTPGEVEAAIETHPAVLEAAVIGVPSPLGEDDVRAYVVLRPGAEAGPDELAAHCASRLAAFKVPCDWRFLDRLPRTATARIAYHLLPREP